MPNIIIPVAFWPIHCIMAVPSPFSALVSTFIRLSMSMFVTTHGATTPPMKLTNMCMTTE